MYQKFLLMTKKKDIFTNVTIINRKDEVVFGLDMEWQPQFRKGQPQHKTALIQICGSDTILLFQVANLKGN